LDPERSEQLADGFAGESPPMVEVIAAVDGAEQWTRVGASPSQPPVQERGGGGREGDQPFLSSLAEYPDSRRFEVQVGEAERRQLGPAGAGEVGQGDDGGFAGARRAMVTWSGPGMDTITIAPETVVRLQELATEDVMFDIAV
jgi:hypothetical protein